jgi:hypothetical protein
MKMKIKSDNSYSEWAPESFLLSLSISLSLFTVFFFLLFLWFSQNTSHLYRTSYDEKKMWAIMLTVGEFRNTMKNCVQNLPKSIQKNLNLTQNWSKIKIQKQLRILSKSFLSRSLNLLFLSLSLYLFLMLFFAQKKKSFLDFSFSSIRGN